MSGNRGSTMPETIRIPGKWLTWARANTRAGTRCPECGAAGKTPEDTSHDADCRFARAIAACYMAEAGRTLRD